MEYKDARLKDFVLGAIYGEAVGDALGHPIEFKKTHKVVGMPSDKPEENKFTDDTQMFACIGEALIEAPPHVDEEKFMTTLGKKFGEWIANPLGGSHRAPGGNCMDGCRKLRAGVHWTKSGGLDSKGNGSAMRSGIVGAYYWKNPEYAFRIGALTSVCTHNNLESLLSAGMVAYLVAASINQHRWPLAISDGLALCIDFARTLPFYPQQVPFGNRFSDQAPWYAIARWGQAYVLGSNHNLGIGIEDAMNRLKDHESIVTDGAGVPAVAEAIYFQTYYPNHFDEAVLASVNNSDDTDTIGAITGTIAGAYHGFLGIPEKWCADLEMSGYFKQLGESIFAASLAYEKSQEKQEQVAADIDYDSLFADGEDVNDQPGFTFCASNGYHKNQEEAEACAFCGKGDFQEDEEVEL